MKRHKPKARVPRQPKIDDLAARNRRLGEAEVRGLEIPASCGSPVTFELHFPIEIRGELRTSLTMRYPIPKDLIWFRLLRGGENARVLAMVCRLCDLPKDAIDELDHTDTIALLDICQKLVCVD